MEREDKVTADIYGNNNQIRKQTTKLAERLIREKNKYPMMVRRHSDKQVNVLSIRKKGSVKTLMDDIIDNGQGYPAMQEGFRYLIRNYLCYVEVPYTRYDKAKNKIESYQKKLVTANPEIIALWMNEDLDEVNKKYKLKFDSYINTDTTHKPVAPYLELKVAKDGEHKITKPRKDIDLEDKGLVVTPLYLINESINTIRDMMKDSCIQLTYTKDNHHERTMTTTLDHEFLETVYGTKTSWVMDVKAKEYSQKDIMECDTVFRGYVRFAEVGGSRYDSATRSLNFARIGEIVPNVEPDLSLIDVDLSTVSTAFATHVTEQPENITEIKSRFKGYNIEKATNLILWEEKCTKEYTTEFKRKLAKFMLNNKDIFENFDGHPIKKETITAGLGIEVDDVDLSDYFEF